jgi:hypothetical protein
VAAVVGRKDQKEDVGQHATVAAEGDAGVGAAQRQKGLGKNARLGAARVQQRHAVVERRGV